jgi:conjugative relaxase-like TrwC/TraI family protein
LFYAHISLFNTAPSSASCLTLVNRDHNLKILLSFFQSWFTLLVMIRMIQSSSSAHAKDYFSEALAKSDYYINDQELNGNIQGKLAERLGLSGPATKEVFFSLCENNNPNTGESLTLRTKQDRTVGYDINFHCPKSVSIVHALSSDEHILKSFQDCVTETMKDIEADIVTRVRKAGQYDERHSGELIWADFVHQTARPVDNALPDPHLHAHCFVFNATYDHEEKVYKAGQFRDIKRDMPYYQARFHKRLSDRLINQGYQIKRTAKSFEIVGVPQEAIDLFSKRTDEIDRVAEEKGIKDDKRKDELGARTRARKQTGHSMDELKAEWKKQLAALDLKGKDSEKMAVRYAPAKEQKEVSAERCVEHALNHSFERASVIHDRRLLMAAYRHGIGHREATLKEITSSLQNNPDLLQVQEKGKTMCTTQKVLSEEQHMVQLARSGQGKMVPVYFKAPDVDLKGQQAEAVKHVLTTSNQVSIIRGAAGSGKTTLMKEAVAHFNKAGKEVMVIAPTSQASRGVLRDEGFDKAETVSKLLMDRELQDKLKNQVLWVDEAGLLGTQDMTALLQLSQQKNARLILGGDTRQHSSVVRGDALRILNTVAGIRTSEVSKIYRQRYEHYRQVVQDLADGQVGSAFEKLDNMGAIENVDPFDPNTKLVNDYAQAVSKGKSVLVISPTHAQSEDVTAEIRKKLRADDYLGKKEIQIDRLTNCNFTEAEKRDWRNMQPGMLVQFNQNLPGIKRGSLWTIEDASEKDVLIKDESEMYASLPLHKSKEYDILKKGTMELSKGDKIRLTRNGFDKDGKRLHNGQLLDVSSVSKKGVIRLTNPTTDMSYTLDQDHGHLTHAYCITSHASQGKTVDEVYIAQPAATFPATDAKQFYVSVSRGRDIAKIYTDDKEELLAHAARLGDRQSAMELVGDNSLEPSKTMIIENIRSNMQRQVPYLNSRERKEPAPARPIIKPKPDRDYEPRI